MLGKHCSLNYHTLYSSLTFCAVLGLKPRVLSTLVIFGCFSHCYDKMPEQGKADFKEGRLCLDMITGIQTLVFMFVQ